MHSDPTFFCYKVVLYCKYQYQQLNKKAIETIEYWAAHATKRNTS